MFTFGWSEIFLIIIIVVVVIGPKDLPKFIKQIASLSKYIKRLSGEFKSSLNEIAEESEIKDITKSISDMKKIKESVSIKKNFENEIKSVKDTVKLAEDELSKKDSDSVNKNG